ALSTLSLHDALPISVRRATNETTGHIGALLILMAMSACVGGIIERSGMMENVPDAFPSIWIAMAMLVATLVFIGMIMDPLGAVRSEEHTSELQSREK